MNRSIALALSLALVAPPLRAQHPLRHFTDGVDLRWSRSQPKLYYMLDIADNDTTGFDVRMSVINAPDTFRIAMVKHPEYDDRYFRYVTNLRVDNAKPATIIREDSALWRVVAPGGIASISYRIQLPPAPPAPRAAWRPFLSLSGGLSGGAHAFMYVVGAELAPAHVTVRVPEDWGIATGLTPTSEPRTYFAPNAYVLVESPILVGRFRQYWFPIDGVPHRIAHWIAPNAAPFDTMAFINGVERMANEVVRLFGRAPYREFTFQFQDNAFGGLEHHNSVSLGTPSTELARNPNGVLPEIAHEFIHTWNLMRIRPAEYTGVSYKPIQPVPTLWFSEGLTMMYADVVLRRAKLPTFDSTRTAHLAGLIGRYFAQPGNSHFSAEQVSRIAYNSRPDALGDYEASTHLQGELLGTMLDVIVRDATNGRRSMDDVMRLMLDRFSGERGFTGPDVERTVADVCGCNVRPFFDAHVRGAQPIPFDRYLGLVGMRAVIARQAAMRDGQPAADSRIRAWNPPDSSLSLIIGDPRSVWGRAGLHSGDRVVSVSAETPKTSQEFRTIIGRARIGDTLRFVVRRPDAPLPLTRTVAVVVTGYDRPLVRIEPLGVVSDKQRNLRDAWLSSRP